MDYRVLSPIDFRVPKVAFLLALSIYILGDQNKYKGQSLLQNQCIQ